MLRQQFQTVRPIVTTLMIVVAFSVGCAARSMTRSSQSQRQSESSKPAARAPAPFITAITPALGSTSGYTPLRISGIGFQSGATVTLDGATLQGRFENQSNGVLYLQTPAHTAGIVDVLVTNPDGQTHRLAGGYTYALPQSFDFNGSWSGFGTDGHHVPVRLTIKNSLLVSLSCDSFTTLTFSPRPSVIDGEFSFSKGNGIVVTGRIVSASAAVGTINLPSCPARWSAARQ
jgi:hypothetical protein